MTMRVEPSCTAAELVEAEANFAMSTSAPSSVREALGMAATRVGSGFVTVMRNDPTGGVFNRAIGLGLQAPLDENVLDGVIAFAHAEDPPLLLVQVAPFAQPEDWPSLLESRGLTPSATWAKFAAAADAVTVEADDVRVEKLGPADGDAFAYALLSGFGLAAEGAAHAWISALSGAGDPWHAYGVRELDQLVAVGWMFRGHESASLLSAATLPEHRRKGYHRALVRRRIADAAAMGCTWVASETGIDTEASPNPAVRSLERAGIPAVYERRNWIWRPAANT